MQIRSLVFCIVTCDGLLGNSDVEYSLGELQRDFKYHLLQTERVIWQALFAMIRLLSTTVSLLRLLRNAHWLTAV